MVNPNQIRKNMEVVGACGNLIGTVDGIEDNNSIRLTVDGKAAGKNHLIPLDWVESVGRDVRLGRSCEEARREWQLATAGANR